MDLLRRNRSDGRIDALVCQPWLVQLPEGRSADAGPRARSCAPRVEASYATVVRGRTSDGPRHVSATGGSGCSLAIEKHIETPPGKGPSSRSSVITAS